MSEKAKKKSTKKTKQPKQDISEQLTQDIQRIQADFINFKKRAEEDKTRAVSIGKSSVIVDLLPVLDNLDRALAHQPQELAENDWVKGIAGVSKQLQGKLTELGLVRVETVGQEFDPNTMEAVSTDGEGDREIVSEELQAGYMLGDELVRPAMVRVSNQ
jgi:molecular chaperone GrpE